jgi:hypothetical protein
MTSGYRQSYTLYMLKIYVDDVNTTAEEMPPGTRWRENRLVIVEEEVKSDKLVPGDMRTARVFQAVGDSINPFIKLTIDWPSQHTDDWMP